MPTKNSIIGISIFVLSLCPIMVFSAYGFTLDSVMMVFWLSVSWSAIALSFYGAYLLEQKWEKEKPPHDAGVATLAVYDKKVLIRWMKIYAVIAVLYSALVWAGSDFRNGAWPSIVGFTIAGVFIFITWHIYNRLCNKFRVAKEAKVAQELARSRIAQQQREAQVKLNEERRQEAMRMQNEKELAEIQRERDALNEFINRHQDLVTKFLRIADRKVSLVDEYGDDNWDALPAEIDAVMRKFYSHLGKENIDLHPLREYLSDRFREYHAATKEMVNDMTTDLSGQDFEVHVMKLLRAAGFEVSGTPATGDQGADIIATNNGKTYIIQAKRWNNPVGNTAVQEVVAAVGYYKGDEAWVVTNSTYTPSAKALATANKVLLIDGHDLGNLVGYLQDIGRL